VRDSQEVVWHRMTLVVALSALECSNAYVFSKEAKKTGNLFYELLVAHLRGPAKEQIGEDVEKKVEMVEFQKVGGKWLRSDQEY
jgi:hypothetical protein